MPENPNANPWQVVNETPAPVTAPAIGAASAAPNQPQSGNQWNVVSETPAPAPKQAPDTSAEEATGGVTGFENYAPSPISKGVTGGMGQEALGMVKALPKIALGVPGLLYDQLKEIPSQYRTYEQARQQGKNPVESMKHVQEEMKKKGNALTALQQRVKELRSADSEESARAIGKTIVDLVPIALGLTESVSAVPEDAAALAIPEEAAVATAARAVAAPEGAVESAVTKAVGKAPVAEGRLATVAPTGEDIQPMLQQGIHDIAEQAAKDSGVKFTKPASVRDAMGTTSRATKASSTADYQALDKASGGRWQRFDDQIENVQRKMDEINGIDEDAYANLEVKRNSIQTDQAQMIEDMKAEGTVDPAIADRAVATYRKAMAQRDVSNAVRAATKRVPVSGKMTDVTDPNGLSTRLQKLNDVPDTGGPSRLEQALGKDGADAFISHVDNAQLAQAQIKEFVPSSATGKQALADLLRPNTEGKLIGSGAKTNFLKAYSDFDKLGPEEQAARFGNDVATARSYLQGKARMQLAKRIALGVGVGAVAKETGLSKYLLHFLIE